MGPVLTLVGMTLLAAFLFLPRPLFPEGITLGGESLNATESVMWLNAVLWWGMAAFTVWRAMVMRVSFSVIRSGLLLFTLFAVMVFPFDKNIASITPETLSMVGVMMFMVGACWWRKAYPVWALVGRGISWINRIPSPVYLLGVYAAFLTVVLALSWTCYRFIPGYDDSIAQYVHGKFIAAGHLLLKSPPSRNFFPMWMMVNDGKWYAQYEPMHESMLALGHLVNAPWIINPLEAALTQVLIYLLARRIFGEGTARIAAILCITCPFMLFLSAEFMNHVTALFYTTLLTYCYVVAMDTASYDMSKAKWWTQSSWLSLAAGLSLGAVFLTRPLDAVGVGIPFALDALSRFRKAPRRYYKTFVLMAVASIACVAFSLWFNVQTTGEALLFPTGKYHSDSNLGAMGYDAHSSIWRGISKAQDEWSRLNLQCFEWPLPSAFFALLFCLLPIKNRHAWLLVGIVVSHTLVNMGNMYASTVFGPRYMYEVVSSLILLTAAGITRMPLLLQPFKIPMPPREVWYGIMALPLLFWCGTTAFMVMPARVKTYTHYFNNHPDFYNAMIEQCQKPALIFIGRGADAESKYKWVAFTNPPDNSKEVIFAVDRGDEQDRELVPFYPGRTVYIENMGKLMPLDANGSTP